MDAPPRSLDERLRDTAALLSATGADTWVATASAAGEAYLVPLSFGWTGEAVVLVTERRSPTARNLIAKRGARLAFGGTRDVVMVDGELAGEPAAVPDADAELVEVFVTQSGWDPRPMGDAADYDVFAVRPVGVQAWREGNEIAGRTLMRDGEWLGPVDVR
ncbi:MAG: pyridoxamine 5'-phosphate oxidase family protein [Acidimicrobiia bacterium]|nr:pyridoxamine 5'-phosphate oxidase family protein [Acidimicrobiia bacterium]